jgi:hypothetical protein
MITPSMRKLYIKWRYFSKPQIFLKRKPVSLADNRKTDYEAGILISNDITVALVRERTIPTERPQLVCEVSASFCG